MMKKLILPLGILASTFASCDNNTSNVTESTTVDTVVNTLKVSTFDNPSPEFPNAILKVKSLNAIPLGADSATVTIVYDVLNYELGAQTADATTKGCNNSKDGQHIHFILNNMPYKALYEPTNTFNVALNQENYLMSFLSRSYHESLKNKEAAKLIHFIVEEGGKIKELATPNTPMLFFSRPKGDYVGTENTSKVLLDYYLYNPNPDQTYQVSATINGANHKLSEWKSYIIEDAPMGQLNVKLELTDKDGNTIEGINTTVEGKATLATSEPVR